MELKFWGTRGSLPAAHDSDAIRRKLRTALRVASGRKFRDEDAIESFIAEELDFVTANSYGGGTACVQFDGDDGTTLLCDMGSGMRGFGAEMLATHGPGNPQNYHILLSHTHWDHIMGFPFFAPAYIPGNVINIYGCHDGLEDALRAQHVESNFPVGYEDLGAEIIIHQLPVNEWSDVVGFRVLPKLQRHSNDSFGYRIERDGKAAVYSTDSEHDAVDREVLMDFADFFREADIVIFDAMYSLADAITVKKDWGHSSNIVGVDICQLANAKHLCMFHHEPAYNDEMIENVLGETRDYAALGEKNGHDLLVSSAYDGLKLTL